MVALNILSICSIFFFYNQQVDGTLRFNERTCMDSMCFSS